MYVAMGVVLGSYPYKSNFCLTYAPNCLPQQSSTLATPLSTTTLALFSGTSQLSPHQSLHHVRISKNYEIQLHLRALPNSARPVSRSLRPLSVLDRLRCTLWRVITSCGCRRCHSFDHRLHHVRQEASSYVPTPDKYASLANPSFVQPKRYFMPTRAR